MVILSPREAMAFLHISESKLYDMKRKKQLEGTYYMVGKRLFFMRDKLKAWAENGGTMQFN